MDYQEKKKTLTAQPWLVSREEQEEEAVIESLILGWTIRH